MYNQLLSIRKRRKNTWFSSMRLLPRINSDFRKIVTSVNMMPTAPKSLNSFWQNKLIRFFQFQFNFLKPTQHLNTNPNDIITAPSVKKLLNQTYQLFLEQKLPQNFFSKTTNSLYLLLPFSLLLRPPLHRGHNS